jgi:predicted acylesterase/phospholipase RssA
MLKSVQECIKKYLEFSESVFDVKKCIAKVPTGKNQAYFDAAPLEEALKNVVLEKTRSTDTPLAETGNRICPVFVVTTRGRDAGGPLKYFKSYGFDKDQTPIWQAARATTAGPAFFPSALVTVPSPPGEYIDGGVRANNPAWIAHEEGREDFETKRCFIVSVGTGEQKLVDFIGKTNLKHTPKREITSRTQPKRSQSEQTTPGDPQRGHTEPDPTQNPDPINGIQQTASGQQSKSFLAHTQQRFKSVGTKFGKSIKATVAPVAQKSAEILNLPGGVKAELHIIGGLVDLSTNSKEVHERILKQINSRDESAKFPYFRFNVVQGMEEIGMEEWRKVNKMSEMTRGYLASRDVIPQLKKCAEGLLYPQAFESA